MSAESQRDNRQPKVLRIGIIQEGKVQVERLVDTGDDVTIGTAKGATFVVPDANLDAPQMTLFAFREGRYHLQFDSQLKGKVSIEGKPVSLDKAREGQVGRSKRHGELWALRLEEQDKGKLRVGSTTVVFQFVPPPPVAVNVNAKVSFRPRLIEDDDPVFLGFLALWSALGVLFMVLVYSIEVPEPTLEELPERFVKLVIDKPPTPEEPPPPPKVDESIKGPSTEAAPKGPSKEDKPPLEKPKNKAEAVDQAKAVEEAKGKLAEENALIAALQAKMIGTTGGNAKGSVLAANAEGDFSGDLDARLQAAAAAGAQVGDGSRVKGGQIGGTGVVDGGGVGIGGDGKNVTTGREPVVSAPKGSVNAGKLDFGGGDVAGIAAIVRRFQGQLVYCHEAALKKNPTTEGRIVVSWLVDAGKATDLVVVDNSTGDDEFAQCVVSKIRMWRFTGVDDGDATSPFIFQRRE